MGKNHDRFGKEFQTHLLTILAQQPEAASQLHSFLTPSFFDGQRNRKAFRFLQKTWRKSKTCPSEALFTEVVADRQLSRKLFNGDTTDWSAALEYAVEFGRQQAVKIFIDQWAGKIHGADSDEYAKMVVEAKEAIAVGQDAALDRGEFFSRDFKKHAENFLSPPIGKEPIPTAIFPQLDILMKGGALRKELHIVAGVAKRGKSMFLLNIAYGCLSPMVDVKTAFFSLEMDTAECWKRLYKRMALRNDDAIENAPAEFTRILEKRRQAFTGDLYLKSYPRKKMTSLMLEADLDRLERSGFRPDVVIVDYGNIMKSISASRERREREADNFNELSRIASEREMVFWSAAQGNRPAVKKATLEMDDIGEAFEIAQIVDGMFSLNQTKKERLANRGRLVCSAGRRFSTGPSIDIAVDFDLSLFRTIGFTKQTGVDDEDEDELEGFRKQRKNRKS